MNIDKDIKELEFSQQQMRLGNLPSYSQAHYRAIENVLTELEKKDKQIKLEIKGRDTLVNLNTELSKELETYKKIAEKLAVKMIYLPISEDGIFYCTKEAVIDWARNEVKYDVN